jgi:hypothetical protein
MNSSDPRVEENLAELSQVLAKTVEPELIASFLRCL